MHEYFFWMRISAYGCEYPHRDCDFYFPTLGVFGFLEVGGKWKVGSGSGECGVVGNWDLWK